MILKRNRHVTTLTSHYDQHAQTRPNVFRGNIIIHRLHSTVENAFYISLKSDPCVFESIGSDFVHVEIGFIYNTQ
jgi:hypothetical protein